MTCGVLAACVLKTGSSAKTTASIFRCALANSIESERSDWQFCWNLATEESRKEYFAKLKAIEGITVRNSCTVSCCTSLSLHSQEQEPETQNPHKWSLFLHSSEQKAPPLSTLKTLQRKAQVHANVIYSGRKFLDYLPLRCSKGQALRFLAWKWQLPVNRFVAAGALRCFAVVDDDDADRML